MRIAAAIAALFMTAIIMIGVPLAVLAVSRLHYLYRWAELTHPYARIFPAFIPLFTTPAIVIALRRKIRPQPEPEPRWTPGTHPANR